MTRFDGVLSQRYLTNRVEHDAMNQAVKHCKAHGIDEGVVKRMILKKKEYSKVRSELESEMLGLMAQGTNLFAIDGPWYAIRYLDDKKQFKLTAEMLYADKAYKLLRGKFDKELSMKDLESMLPDIRDMDALALHKMKVFEIAEMRIREYTGVTIPVTNKSDMPVMPTNHALRRRAERKFGISELESGEYVNKNRKDVEYDLMQEFDTSEHMWTDDDGYEYRFGAENTMFVVNVDENMPDRKAIITLYEERFGFDKAINRSIVYQQMDVIKQKHKEFKECVGEYDHVHERSSSRIYDVDTEIEHLKAQIELLEADKASYEHDLFVAKNQLKVGRLAFNKEYDKLFKKWTGR